MFEWVATSVAVVHLDSTFPANGDEAKDYSKLAEHSEPVVSVVLRVTSLAGGSSEDAVTSEVLDSFVAITEETGPDIEDYFRVAVRQVFVLNWVSKLELVVEPQPALLPFDFHSLATFRVPFDVAFELDYDLEESDLPAVSSLQTDVGSQLMNGASLMKRVDFVVPSEIVAGIGIAVEFHVMILRRVVGPLDSSRDVVADAIAVAVAVDDFEEFESSEIVVSVGCRVVASRLDLD